MVLQLDLNKKEGQLKNRPSFLITYFL